ncbi:hypothetical protein M2271_008234 [Streptomyces sp. LBL]|uniref:hypothetical protein n=1 Tax=Streptomyces sp. LBL TaxID=2940562 RepID=UPI002474DD35|nr:hypothetical protein [Streptomyces sp. LBL]MDH6630374.1 hypothetical protein [Streptomyces sp. LBL]
MSSTASGLQDAAELVRYGCRPRQRPLADARYRDLLHRYRMEGAFRERVDAIAQGLGVEVIAAHPQEGLVLHAADGGLFTYRIKDDVRRTAQQRLVAGLVHVAIAARVYPTEHDLDDESVKRIGVAEVDDFLRHLVEQLREASQGEDGLPVPDAAVDAVWRLYARRPSGKPTAGGRGVTQVSTKNVIREVLEWLVHQGMALPAPEFGPGHYRLLHRFRLQVREAAALPAFETLRDIRRAQTADTDTEEM